MMTHCEAAICLYGANFEQILCNITKQFLLNLGLLNSKQLLKDIYYQNTHLIMSIIFILACGDSAKSLARALSCDIT